MTILVCGGRDYRNAKPLCLALEPFGRGPSITLVNGGAQGADRIARLYAFLRGWTRKTYRADWNRHGRAAGPIRNQRMLDEEKVDLVVAAPGGRGTADMARRARTAGVRVVHVVE